MIFLRILFDLKISMDTDKREKLCEEIMRYSEELDTVTRKLVFFFVEQDYKKGKLSDEKYNLIKSDLESVQMVKQMSNLTQTYYRRKNNRVYYFNKKLKMEMDEREQSQ